MTCRRVWISLAAVVVSSLIAACGLPYRPATVAPPTSGALFGAYVDPARYSEDSRIAAFEDFERLLGRQLAIYHNYHPWDAPFPSRSDQYFAERGTTLLLSWAGADTRRIVSGEYDALIRSRAEAIGRLGSPVLLRWRWEMNRPNLAQQIHSGADYIAAWRHIHDIFTELGVDNVGWVWCPLSDDLADDNFGDYYPGDSYVDWICADGYARSAQQSFKQVFSPFVAWARRVQKPILIGEFGRAEGRRGSRARWLDGARLYVEETPQIKAVSYFQSARGASGNYSVIKEPSAVDAMKTWANERYFNPHP